MKYGHPRGKTLDRLETAITEIRSPAVFIQAASAECSFGTRKVTQRIYATPWDGNIVITARLDGVMTVATKQ